MGTHKGPENGRGARAALGVLATYIRSFIHSLHINDMECFA
jgi:hypothetical protein